ncbi:MAG: heme A synthase [SAR116 cluster bacterium]|nr:heme A synthase [SAR116 cluster bacterium]
MLLEQKNNSSIILWLGIVLIAVILMVFIGGVTRLTDSGLSMVEWKPILGFFPPLSHEEWLRVFELYKNTPEYKYYNKGMELDEFKIIFFWEYFHRFWGRIIGLIFIIPFLYFIIKKRLSQKNIISLTLILTLGTFQAAIGWWMVKSGLINKPDVSQYRLAIHLSNAFVIMFLLLWLILDLYEGESKIKFNLTFFTLILVSITIIAGSFVAGMDAGLMYNTYPLMNEKILPDQYLTLGYLDPFENPGSAQFHHRHLGLLCLILSIFFYFKNYNKKEIRIRINVLLILILAQFFLGIFILLNYVPIIFASLHQVGAMMIFLIFISIIHKENIYN